MSVFWIYEGSEYARILNIPVRVTQGSEYASLNLPEYVWMYRNMRKYD